MVARSYVTLDDQAAMPRFNPEGTHSSLERSTGGHFLPKLGNHSLKGTVSPQLPQPKQFKKNYSMGFSKFASPIGASATVGKITHGLATQMFNNNPGYLEKPDFNSTVNPFKHKHNM